MNKRFTHLVLPAIALCICSCNNMPSRNHGPIVLGDPSTIVTETDSTKLQDMVADLKPNIKPAANTDTVATAIPVPPPQQAPEPAAKTAVASPVQQQQQAPVSGTGLKADFDIMSLLIPNINAKQSGNPNLSHANGAVYTLVSGNLNNNVIRVTANVTKVSQRYQTIIVLKNELGVLPLESLMTTTSWEPLRGANNIYHIAGLDEKSLDYEKAGRSAIQNAVAKSARRHRMSRRKVQDWEHSVRNVHATNQKPLYVMLRSVMWKIDGKDNNGKIFSKQIRIDIPL